MVSKAKSAILRNENGAIAPLFALSLFALIAVGGIAFDYARLAGMDSELQNAADQAALAAATQLDGGAGACARASGAAVSLVSNDTLFANEVVGVPDIVISPETSCDNIGKIRFYQDKAKANAATSDSNARFVEVQVNARTARYALTPIVGAVSSGAIDATAYAGLGSAICRVPPVMLCNPFEATTVGADFDANGLSGAGVRLIGGNADAPGNFGFLDTDGSNSTPDLARALGYDRSPGDCSPTDLVDTKTGLRDVVFNAFNTRFDISVNGANTCPTGGSCSAARNTRKDLVRRNQCSTTGGNGWQESPVPYRPTTVGPLTSGYPDIMGHPRDMCHAVSKDGSCPNGKVGNKAWDRDAYFRVNYGWNNSQWISNTGLSNNATRFQVHQWEMANPQQTVKPVGGGRSGYGTPICRAAAGAGDPDRRRISAAVINCEQQGLNGNEDGVTVLKWVDLFLVEPSYERKRGSVVVTDSIDIYVEVIGETQIAGGGNNNQVIRRDVPYLIE